MTIRGWACRPDHHLQHGVAEEGVTRPQLVPCLQPKPFEQTARCVDFRCRSLHSGTVTVVEVGVGYRVQEGEFHRAQHDFTGVPVSSRWPMKRVPGMSNVLAVCASSQASPTWAHGYRHHP